jgi:hypothetical protein
MFDRDKHTRRDSISLMSLDDGRRAISHTEEGV